MGELKQVWSFGGGRQSCGLGALIIQGKFPKPDIAVMADTGREKQRTWDYLNQFVLPGLRSVGLELHIIKSDEWAYEKGLTHKDGALMLPAFTDAGKNSPDCSGAWKRDAINRWLSRVHGITRSQYVGSGLAGMSRAGFSKCRRARKKATARRAFHSLNCG